MTTLQTHKT